MNRLEWIAPARERETRAQNFLDDDRAVGLLKPLNQQVELVTLPQVAAHVDFVLENVGE